jgi:hypothetical protein
MSETRRFVAVLGIAAAVSVLSVTWPAALPAVGAETGPFPFKAPPAGTVLIYNDGFQVAFGKTKGRVSIARAGPKSAPRCALMEIEDTFMVRRIQRGRRLLESKNTVEGPGLWPLVPGATRRYSMAVSLDGKPRQTQRAVARFAKTVTTLMLADKPRRVIQVDVDVRWTSPSGKAGRAEITYFHDLDLGYYDKRLYTRYGPEGRPRTPVVRELVRVEQAKGTPKR